MFFVFFLLELGLTAIVCVWLKKLQNSPFNGAINGVTYAWFDERFDSFRLVQSVSFASNKITVSNMLGEKCCSTSIMTVQHLSHQSTGFTISATDNIDEFSSRHDCKLLNHLRYEIPSVTKKIPQTFIAKYAVKHSMITQI